MKRFICLILVIQMITVLCACNNKHKVKNPVNQYYLSADITESNLLIRPEVCEAHESLVEQINNYLRGPSDEAYFSPFPDNVYVIAINQSDSISEIILSDSFASLTGYDLTIACACLTKTLQELVDTKLVKIRTENEPLDGNAYITMSADAIIAIDAAE